jgi:hypothetical protein
MELLPAVFDHEGTSEQVPAPRRNAMVARWRYRRDMEELVRRHTTDTNAAMAPVDRIQGLLHGDTN